MGFTVDFYDHIYTFLHQAVFNCSFYTISRDAGIQIHFRYACSLSPGPPTGSMSSVCSHKLHLILSWKYMNNLTSGDVYRLKNAIGKGWS